jgi:hypothetical protein
MHTSYTSQKVTYQKKKSTIAKRTNQRKEEGKRVEEIPVYYNPFLSTLYSP